tara:strand:- start:1065 stop:2870 length:1806 start_codon:yes stop_codon:yes gene_type:complete
MLKTHNCGELDSASVGEEVTLAGWVNRRRDHGGLIFLDLRDRSGIVQVTFDPDKNEAIYSVAEELRSEWVVKIEGSVSSRPDGTNNPNISSGEIEIHAHKLEVLNKSLNPPFYINEESDVDESLRLEYRYLDLRRDRMYSNILLRHNVVKFIRDFLDDQNFLEIETPILMKSTPEGARDYLVPSRVYPGHFFALPQSPQQLKQLLMIGGIEKYFQIARCFRDEDLRADRQPEFTQLDLEISFVEEADIFELVEELFTNLVSEITPELELAGPFPIMTYEESMDRFGSDKPDLRFSMELTDITNINGLSQMDVFQSVIDENGIIKAIVAPGGSKFSRREITELTEVVRSRGAKGLLTVAIEGDAQTSLSDVKMDDIKSPLSKYLTVGLVKDIAAKVEASVGDMLLIVAGERSIVDESLGELRNFLGDKLEMKDPNKLNFAFITEFPLFQWSKEREQWESTHHPFTSPKLEEMHLLDESPGDMRSRAYDCVLNGYEIASGSIRIHERELQENLLRFIGYSQEEMEGRFGHLLNALSYGAPPHGGIAAGIDRLVAVLAGEPNIREVIPFPKTQTSQDLLTKAPSLVDVQQLQDIGLSINDIVEE